MTLESIATSAVVHTGGITDPSAARGGTHAVKCNVHLQIGGNYRK